MQPVLDRFSTVDLQQTLSARAHLKALAAIARERGWTLVVLKGAVAVSEGVTTHLWDVDVLVRPEHAQPLAREIATRLGLRAESSATQRHLAPLSAQHVLAVEIHQSIDSRRTSLTTQAWERIRPLTSVPGLFRLAPPDHVAHMLAHVVVDHPDRRGRLRDTVLLRRAIAECSAEDLEAVRDHLSRSVHARELGEQLDFARAFAGGKPAQDPYELVAFTNFWMSEHLQRGWRGRVPIWKDIYGTVWVWASALVAARPVRQWLLDALLTPTADRSRLAATSWLERHAPRLGRALRLTLRTIHYAMAGTVALPIAVAVRYAASRAGAKTGSSS
jgi:hypothetical protein